MKKQLLRLIQLLFLAVIIAGGFGIVHNQISYTISPDYFLKFKFIQFQLDWAYKVPRLGASVVGFLASWWMGVLICLPLEAIAQYKLADADEVFSRVLGAVKQVVFLTAVSSVLGLVLGVVFTRQVEPGYYPELLKRGIYDPLRFIQAGWMHNGSYFGAVLGTVWVIFKLLKPSHSL